MANWIMSANPMIYDHKRAFDKNGFIDWNQTRNFEIGDNVYIYSSKGVSSIQYLAEVVWVNMSPKEIIDDTEFWKDGNRVVKKRYMRLKLIKCVDNPGLHYSYLKENGMPYAPQSPCIVKPLLQNYLDTFFKEDSVNE